MSDEVNDVVDIEKDTVKDTGRENAIEFLNGQKTCTVTFNSRKHINRIKKLYSNADYKNNIEYLIENNDGSVCARIPLKWIKINPGRAGGEDAPKKVMSEEHKAKLMDALKKAREEKRKTKEINNV